MKFDIFSKRLFKGMTILCAALAFSSCEADLTYEEADESQYTQVGVSAVNIYARELFQNKMYAVNWNNKVVENYLHTVTVGTTSDFQYINTSGSVVTLNDGTKVQPGETVTVKSTRTEESLAEAPNGKLTVFNIYAVDHAIYDSPNNGYMFATNLFGSEEHDLLNWNGDNQVYEEASSNKARYVSIPVRKNELIAAISMATTNYDCLVEPVGNSPALGYPADYTQPQRYMVVNIANRPAGVEQHKAMYEIRITFLPGRRAK